MKSSMMIRHIARAKRSLAHLVGLAMSLPAIAMAQGLPNLEEPSTGGGGLRDTMQGYLYDFGILIGLLLATAVFLVVGSASIASFKEARERETWGKFALTVVVGVVLVIAIIWLTTEAAPILMP